MGVSAIPIMPDIAGLGSFAGTRPCTLLTLSELSFTIREALFSFGPHTHHEPVGRCVATIDLRIARVRPQGCTRDHRGRQWGGRRVASCSRRLSAADRGAGSLRRAGACDVSRLCTGTGVQCRHRNRDGTERTGTRSQAGAGGHRSGWPRRDGGTGERSPAQRRASVSHRIRQLRRHRALHGRDGQGPT